MIDTWTKNDAFDLGGEQNLSSLYETEDERDDIISLSSNLVNLVIDRQWRTLRCFLKTWHCTKIIQQWHKDHPVTLLHVACTVESVPIDIIIDIIKAYPEACLLYDEDGSLPVHLACSLPSVHVQTVKTLMIACPTSCFQREHVDGEIAIYLLLKNPNITGAEAIQFIETLPISCIVRYDRTQRKPETTILHEICHHILPEKYILQIIRLHPQICKIQNTYGETLLHCLCSNMDVSSNLIKAVIEINPDACSKSDNAGDLPIHLVASRDEPEAIISMLTKAFFKGLFVPNFSGEIPLMSPSNKRSSRNVISFLKLAGNTVGRMLSSKNINGKTPREDFYFSLVKMLDSQISVPTKENISLTLSSKIGSPIRDHLISLSYIMKLVEYGSINFSRNGSRLAMAHNSSYWVGFPLFTKIILLQSPGLAREQDWHGDLPLHVAVKYNTANNKIYLCRHCEEMCANGTRCTFCRKPLKNNPFEDNCEEQSVVDILRAYPRAAKLPDHNGRFPLHLALHSGKSWDISVRDIFEAAPDVINVCDSKSRLFPFMIAASQKPALNIIDPNEGKDEEIGRKSNWQDQSMIQLCTVYELLRKEPSQVRLGIPNDDNKDDENKICT